MGRPKRLYFIVSCVSYWIQTATVILFVLSVEFTAVTVIQ